ncbi:hypothetical protein [Streptomyces griseoluteus]|uniref:hypothetical protein n=1 Tax=Streptomyces griseoluteus TaxID=29306 RepID=UPI00368021AB
MKNVAGSGCGLTNTAACIANRPDVHLVEAEPDVQRAVLNRQLDVDAGIGCLGGFASPLQGLVQRAEVDGERAEDLLTHVVADRDAKSPRRPGQNPVRPDTSAFSTPSSDL